MTDPAATPPPPSGPVVSSSEGTLDVFALDTDRNVIHVQRTEDKPWLDAEMLGGPAMAPVSAAALEGRIDLFMIGGDAALYRKRWAPTPPTPRLPLVNWDPPAQEWRRCGVAGGRTLLGRPEPVVAPEWFGAFVLCSDSRIRLYREAHDPQVDIENWHEVGEINAPLTRFPPKALMRVDSEVMDVFATDLQGHVHHLEMYLEDPAANDWTDLGCSTGHAVVARPGAVRTNSGGLAVYMLDTYSKAYCKRRPAGGHWPSSWDGRTSRMRTVFDGIAIPGREDHDFDVFGRTWQSTIYQEWFDTDYRVHERGTGVSDLRLIDRPQVVSPRPWRLDLFSLAGDGCLYQRTATCPDEEAGIPWTWAHAEQVPIGQVIAL